MGRGIRVYAVTEDELVVLASGRHRAMSVWFGVAAGGALSCAAFLLWGNPTDEARLWLASGVTFWAVMSAGFGMATAEALVLVRRTVRRITGRDAAGTASETR